MHRLLAAAAFAALLLFARGPLARADESHDQVGVPVPEESSGAVAAPEQPGAEATEPATEASSDASTAPPADGIPAYAKSEAPIDAVHRPSGAWGPIAAAADVLVLRPFGFISLFPGAAAFVAVSPVAAATQSLGDHVDTLKDRAEDVFIRPPGAL